MPDGIFSRADCCVYGFQWQSDFDEFFAGCNDSLSADLCGGQLEANGICVDQVGSVANSHGDDKARILAEKGHGLVVVVYDRIAPFIDDRLP